MARRVSFFFVTVILCNVLVRGQPPVDNPAATPTTDMPATAAPVPGATPPAAAGTPSALPAVQVSPECAKLNPKCMDDMPFLTGESIWWVGKIYVNPSASSGSPATTPGVTPATTPSATPATTPGATPVTTPSATPATVPGATPTTVPGATPAAVPSTDPSKPCDPAVPPVVPNGTTPTPGGATPTPGGDNTCSINSYKADSCQGIKMLISRNEDGSICLKEAVFNKVTNSVSLIKNMWLPADPSKAMLKQAFGYYGTMDQSGTIKIVDTAPAEVKTAQSVDLVLMGASETGEWALFSTCCKTVVFVMYSDATVCAKSMKTFDAAITPLLQPLGVKPEDLKDVPTEITIKVDTFIPTLPPAPAAGATSTGATPAAVPETAAPVTTAPVTAAPVTAAPVTATPPATTPPPATP